VGVILVTGVAGFIGSATALVLQASGNRVIGVDNINNYYSQDLKKARLARLDGLSHFDFHHLDIVDFDTVADLFTSNQDITHIIHLAGQPGVRHSLENPLAYLHANVIGHGNIIQAARSLPRLQRAVYASSSSIYGMGRNLPLSTEQELKPPKSLYAATKMSNELISQTFADLHGLPQVGLRFFTVYGPWGRPDMAPSLFSRAILAGDTIKVFNNGNMRRDFTYIDDAVAGILSATFKRLPDQHIPHWLYNLGNDQAEPLMQLIALLEACYDRQADKVFLPMQPGDVRETWADIDATRRDLDFSPQTRLADGIPRFCAWYQHYYQSQRTVNKTSTPC
jgi:UDP-glucuronate 4-epimerase